MSLPLKDLGDGEGDDVAGAVRRWLQLHGLESLTYLRFADARNADEGPALFGFKDHRDRRGVRGKQKEKANGEDHDREYPDPPRPVSTSKRQAQLALRRKDVAVPTERFGERGQCFSTNGVRRLARLNDTAEGLHVALTLCPRSTQGCNLPRPAKTPPTVPYRAGRGGSAGLSLASEDRRLAAHTHDPFPKTQGGSHP
jgi:hypothetical protein